MCSGTTVVLYTQSIIGKIRNIKTDTKCERANGMFEIFFLFQLTLDFAKGSSPSRNTQHTEATKSHWYIAKVVFSQNRKNRTYFHTNLFTLCIGFYTNFHLCHLYHISVDSRCHPGILRPDLERKHFVLNLVRCRMSCVGMETNFIHFESPHIFLKNSERHLECFSQ